MKPVVRTCLIGFGNVGQGLYLRAENKNSHLCAINANKNFELVAIVDPAINNQLPGLSDVRCSKSVKGIQGVNVDLVVIASPTNTHLDICRESVNFLNPRAILIEKPVGLMLEECNEIKMCLQQIPTILVNYQRNYNRKILQQLTDIIGSGYSKGVVYYSNGAINNASHGLALFISILGKPTKVFNLSNSKKERFSGTDMDFVVEFKESRISFIAIEEKHYSTFRIELFGPKGSWLYDASLERSELRTRVDDPIYVGRFSLTKNSTITPIPDTESFNHVYDYLEKRIRGDSDLEPYLGASLELAYKVHEVIEKAQK